RQRVDPSAREVSGFSRSGYKCYQHSLYRVYFAARFSRRFAAYGTWRKTVLSKRSIRVADTVPDSTSPPLYKPIPGGPARLPGDPSRGAQAGSYVTFAPGPGPIEV